MSRMSDLARDRARLNRTSTTERVADVLRMRMIEGMFAPGARLGEVAICEALGVSRNTVREAFQLLAHEGLVVHHLSRGVFVREFTDEDIADLYRTRKMIECGAIREAFDLSPEALAPIAEAVRAGEKAAADEDWPSVFTASTRFHRSLVALAGSERASTIMERLLAELRLVFPATLDPVATYVVPLRSHRAILTMLSEGRRMDAIVAVAEYLEQAKERMFANRAQSAND